VAPQHDRQSLSAMAANESNSHECVAHADDDSLPLPMPSEGEHRNGPVETHEPTVGEEQMKPAKKLVSWYANPTSQQVRAKGKKVQENSSEESRVWVLEVCEEWRTCHICNAPDVHTEACGATDAWGNKLAGKPFHKGFKLWELKSLEEPADGPAFGRYWYSNLDARPEDVDERVGMPMGQQRFTPWHRTHVKMKLPPGSWVRVQVIAGQKMFKKKLLRYVTIVDELAARDRAYERLARTPVTSGSTVAYEPTTVEPKTVVKKKKISAAVEARAHELSTDDTAARGVAVMGPLGGASGEAVLPESVVVVGLSARGRTLKRREVIEVESDDDTHAVTVRHTVASSNPVAPKRGRGRPKKVDYGSCKPARAAAGHGASAANIPVAVGVVKAQGGGGGGFFQGQVVSTDCNRTDVEDGTGVDDLEDRRLSVQQTLLKPANACLQDQGLACKIGIGHIHDLSSAVGGADGRGVSVMMGGGDASQQPTSEMCTNQPTGVSGEAQVVTRTTHTTYTTHTTHTMPHKRTASEMDADVLHAQAQACSNAVVESTGVVDDAERARQWAREICMQVSLKIQRGRGRLPKHKSPVVQRSPKKSGRSGLGGDASHGSQASQDSVVVEVSSDDEVEGIDAERARDEASGVSDKDDELFELLLWMITVGDLGGGQTVFQMLGSPKGHLVKASILFGNDDRYSFKVCQGCVRLVLCVRGSCWRACCLLDWYTALDYAAHMYVWIWMWMYVWACSQQRRKALCCRSQRLGAISRGSCSTQTIQAHRMRTSKDAARSRTEE
jgi:hypothetical protein